jgi:hypothetical protein
MMIWIQVRDIHAEHARLAAAGVSILREPATEPWGLTQTWIEDPDEIRIILAEVPAGHPLRRDRDRVTAKITTPTRQIRTWPERFSGIYGRTTHILRRRRATW